MSWDAIVFDIFTPKVKGTLTTSGLQYSGESIVTATASCKTSCNCGDYPACCTPTFNNVCTSSPLIASKIQSIDGEHHNENAMGCPEDRCYYQICNGTENQKCAKIEDLKTCTMGSSGSGQIEGSPAQGTNWNLQDFDNYQKGWIECTYNWDYSQYNNTNIPFGPVSVFNALTGIVLGKNPAGDSLTSEMKSRILASNIVYATILEFYNQIYSQGWYANRPTASPFYSVDYLGQGFGDFIDSIIRELSTRTGSLFPLSIFPPDLYNCLQEVLLPPSPRQRTDNPEVYELTLYLSFPLYQSYVSSQKDSFFNFLIAGLLRDFDGKMENQDSFRSWIPENPEFENSTLESVSAIQLSPNYLVKSGIAISDFTPANYPNFIFACARVTATVKKWSPMLAAYFQAFNQNINFSTATCNLIANAGEYPSTVPNRCILNDCEEYNDKCKASMINYCNFSYSAPANTTTLENLLVQNNNKNCYCYSSRVAPSREKSSGLPSGMCFSKNCPEKLLAMFNLDDSKCQDYCSKVYNWMNSTDPAEHCQNCDELDKDKLNRLCPLYNSPTNDKINLQVLFLGIFISIMSGLLSFSICKNREYTGVTTSLVIFISCSILLGLTIFLSFELRGKSICDGKTFKCYSGLTTTQIPLEFCSETLPCECALNNDCESKSCVCVSSACLPSVGIRPSTVVYERKISWLTIIAGGICTIILPLILMYLHNDYHWNISKSVYALILLLLALGPISYILYRSLKKYPRTVFTAACNSCVAGCPVGSTACGEGNDCICCDDSSICSLGNCINTNKYYISMKNYPTYFLGIDLSSDVDALSITNDPNLTFGWRIKRSGDYVNFIMEQNNQVYYLQAYVLYPRYININDSTFDPKDPNLLWNFDKTGRISTMDNSRYLYLNDPANLLVLIGPNDQPQNPGGYVWLTTPV